jgi:hypothetical protein
MRMTQKHGCSKCRFSRRGCSKCDPNFVPLRSRTPSRKPARAPCTITVVPFARTNGEGRIVTRPSIHWALTHSTRVDELTVVDVYFGADWTAPPYDTSRGAVLRLTLASSACVMHVPELSITVGEVVEALKIATRATLGEEDTPLEDTDPPVFNLDSLDMNRYDRVASDSSVLPNDMALSTFVKQNVYRINNPLILHMLLRA